VDERQPGQELLSLKVLRLRKGRAKAWGGKRIALDTLLWRRFAKDCNDPTISPSMAIEVLIEVSDSMALRMISRNQWWKILPIVVVFGPDEGSGVARK
jgi:hypothetical protein